MLTPAPDWRDADMLYLALSATIGASHTRAPFREAAGNDELAFPRVLTYLCDQNEETAILCLEPGQCHFPCYNCEAPLAELASPSL